MASPISQILKGLNSNKLMTALKITIVVLLVIYAVAPCGDEVGSSFFSRIRNWWRRRRRRNRIAPTPPEQPRPNVGAVQSGVAVGALVGAAAGGVVGGVGGAAAGCAATTVGCPVGAVPGATVGSIQGEAAGAAIGGAIGGAAAAEGVAIGTGPEAIAQMIEAERRAIARLNLETEHLRQEIELLRERAHMLSGGLP